MIEGRATARYVRTSAQKAKLVVDLIRGKDVDSALATLRFARKGVAKDVEKVLRSAIANAQQKEGAGDEIERLYIRECYADQGPTLKRVRAAPMGRAFRILKRTSHLTVIVEERSEGQAGYRARRRRGGPEGTRSGGGGRPKRRPVSPPAAPEPDVLEPDVTREPPEPDVPETNVIPEPEAPEQEPEAPEPEAESGGTDEPEEAPEPDATPEPEAPEPEKKPEEPEEEPPTLPPGGILGIR